MSTSENEKVSQHESDPFNESDYDHLDRKNLPENRQEDDLKSLQERLEQYKKDPAGTPWESAFEKLINPNAKGGFDVC